MKMNKKTKKDDNSNIEKELSRKSYIVVTAVMVVMGLLEDFNLTLIGILCIFTV
jgi:hypothetical protein